MAYLIFGWRYLLSFIDINNIKNSASGVAKQTPLIPKYLGKINKNNNKKTNEREIVIMP